MAGCERDGAGAGRRFPREVVSLKGSIARFSFDLVRCMSPRRRRTIQTTTLGGTRSRVFYYEQQVKRELKRIHISDNTWVSVQ
jgi:hypothetical protein